MLLLPGYRVKYMFKPRLPVDLQNLYRNDLTHRRTEDLRAIGLSSHDNPGTANIGIDLRVTEERELGPGEIHMFETGIGIKAWKEVQDRSRTGLQSHTALVPAHVLVGIRSGAGTKGKLRITNALGFIDNAYNGTIKINLQNESHDSVRINRFERVAQAIIVDHAFINQLAECKTLEEFSGGHERGSGFGSSGKV